MQNGYGQKLTPDVPGKQAPVDFSITSSSPEAPSREAGAQRFAAPIQETAPGATSNGNPEFNQSPIPVQSPEQTGFMPVEGGMMIPMGPEMAPNSQTTSQPNGVGAVSTGLATGGLVFPALPDNPKDAERLKQREEDAAESTAFDRTKKIESKNRGNPYGLVEDMIVARRETRGVED